MGSWIVSADLLARSRFVISPLSETVAALTVLSAPEPPAMPWHREFRTLYREAFLAMLAADEILQAAAGCLWQPRRGRTAGWMAGFLALPPIGSDATFEDELEQLGQWDDDRIRAEIRRCTHHPLPAALGRPNLRGAVTSILEWVWTATLVPDWSRRRRVLEADIITRTSCLASRGWADVFGALGPGTRWLGNGHLEVNGYAVPSRDLAAARELSFVPVHAHGSWTVLDPPDRFALIYPVTGALADIGQPQLSGLARLIGSNRARILKLLGEPRTTTQLTALTGLPPGSVSSHLRVLLEASLVLRRRTGREVLYWRTSLGDSLAAAGR